MAGAYDEMLHRADHWERMALETKNNMKKALYLGKASEARACADIVKRSTWEQSNDSVKN